MRTGKADECASPSYDYPRKAGIYWLHRENVPRAVIVNVRRKARKLIAQLEDRYVPVMQLKGIWRGPISHLPHDERSPFGRGHPRILLMPIVLSILSIWLASRALGSLN